MLKQQQLPQQPQLQQWQQPPEKKVQQRPKLQLRPLIVRSQWQHCQQQQLPEQQ
jgi:hypothetical protein